MNLHKFKRAAILLGWIFAGWVAIAAVVYVFQQYYG